MTTSQAPEPEIADLPEVVTAVVGDVVAMTDLAGFFDRSFSLLATTLAEQGAVILGPAFALYHGTPEESVDLEVGFPTDRAVRSEGGVSAGALPGGRVARLTHVGGYDQLGSSWERLRAWIDGQGLTPGPDFWEVYVTEPSPDMDPATLRTDLHWPLVP
jgi:effector-binding domain-containing protein